MNINITWGLPKHRKMPTACQHFISYQIAGVSGGQRSVVSMCGQWSVGGQSAVSGQDVVRQWSVVSGATGDWLPFRVASI